MRRVKPGRPVNPLAERIKVGTCGFAMGRSEYYRTYQVVEIEQR